MDTSDVNYGSGAKLEEHDVTYQAFQQKWSLRNYVRISTGWSPFVHDLIWLRGINRNQLHEIRHGVLDNALSSEVTFDDLLLAIVCTSQGDIKNNVLSIPGSDNNQSIMADIKHVFTARREVSPITRQKLELLNNSPSLDSLVSNVGHRLSIISGRAGTGKTVQLLQVAYRLAEQGKHCLLLTYNKALVSDIRRIIDISNMRPDSSWLTVTTADSFFWQVMRNWGHISKGASTTNYKTELQKSLNSFYQQIKDFNEKELNDYHNTFETSWDYIFIDEAQDWEDLGKQFIYKLYGPERIVVADGVDQFMMSSKRQSWAQSIHDVYAAGRMDTTKRQRANLADFVNAFAEAFKLGWKVKANAKLPGGDVFIHRTRNFTSSVIADYIEPCYESGECDRYDTLLLVPPSEVEQDAHGKHHFRKMEAYQQANIKLFDGTNEDNRNLYPGLNAMRVYQYDSCRGLEGWVTICYDFDKLISHKLKNTPTASIASIYNGLDPEEGKRRFVYTWALMPLTRPMSQLHITLDDPQSELGKALKYIADNFSDSVHWEIE